MSSKPKTEIISNDTQTVSNILNKTDEIRAIENSK